MGVIKQGILGGFSGKVAGVVGSSWKGIAVIKSLPLSVANPKTAGQVAQRGAMTQIVIVSRLLLASILQPFWNPFAQKMSGYNAFVKENIDTFTTAGFTVFADFFSMRGSLINADTLAASASAGGTDIDLTWVDNSGTADALATDEAVVVYYNATQDYWGTSVAGAIRSAAALNIVDANLVLADVLHVYPSMTRPNASKVSDSTYILVNVAA